MSRYWRHQRREWHGDQEGYDDPLNSCNERVRDHLAERGIYRARDGVILGVCKGLATYLDFPLFWLRAIAVAMLFLSGFVPMIVFYFLAGILMKPEPVIPFKSFDDREFYDSYVSSKSMALHRVKRSFENLDRRIRRMEDIVTATEYDWDQRLNGG